MDKVRAFLAVVWQQRFWVLCVAGTLAAVVCWMLAAGQLQADFKADIAAIKGKFQDMDGLSKNMGNPVVNSKEREEAVKIAASVRQLWQKLYDMQSESVLKWPAVLGADFVSYIERRKFDSPINADMRRRYLNYIKNRFDALVEIVDARKDLEGAAFASGRGEFAPTSTSPAVQDDYVVEWADQNALRMKLEFPSEPSSRKVWVTQEDLWVYETLLNVIKNTNDERGATRPDNAAIRVIQTLEVGAAAAQLTAQEPQILMPAGSADAMAPAGDVMPMEQPMSPDGGYGETGEGVDADAFLLAGRYVDAEGKPIADASTGLTAEYRKLPIYMKLAMEQNRLPTVLVECANATLPIEVTRVRINPEKSGTDKDNQAFEMLGAGAGGAAPGMGGYGGEYGGRGSEMGGGMGYVGRPMGREFGGRGGYGGYGRGGEMGGYGSYTSTADVSDLAIVEIHGLVYIYNPPDATSLSVPGGEADIAAAGDSMVR